MELNRVRYSCGTSNAAALASRCAALAYERISAIDLPDDCVPLDDEYYTVLLKALLDIVIRLEHRVGDFFDKKGGQFFKFIGIASPCCAHRSFSWIISQYVSFQ